MTYFIEPRIATVQNEVLPSNWRQFCAHNRIQLHLLVLHENQAQNGKLYPAQSILERGLSRGDHHDADTVIDSTSGNFGIALAKEIARGNRITSSYPLKRVIAVVPRSLPQGKRERLIENGITVIDADDQIHAMIVAKRLAKEHGYWYTKQYDNEDNSIGWHPVAEFVANQLPMLGIVAWGVGSGGGCSGVMPILHERFEGRLYGFHRVAVVVEDGQKVGGVRDEQALEPGSLQWRAPHIDDVRFVGADRSYHVSAALWRQENCGPSTGFAVEGAFLAARSLGIMHKLDAVRAQDGFVHVLVPSLDKRAPYRAEYERNGVYLLANSDWK